MSLAGCTLFIILFYPAIFARAWFTRNKTVLCLAVLAVIAGGLFSYNIYFDDEFWTGWIPGWYRSAQVGYGHAGLIFSLVYAVLHLAGLTGAVRNSQHSA